MLSSKLKSWVESHLTRSAKKPKPSSSSSSKRWSKCNSNSNINTSSNSSGGGSVRGGVSAGGGAAMGGATEERLPPNVGHLSNCGRSNAALVIQLQNDMASNATWAKHSQLVNSPLITWKHRHHPHTPTLLLAQVRIVFTEF